MFARLCTTIRWLGTAMFVAVLIVWGYAATGPMEKTIDLSTQHAAKTDEFHLYAYSSRFEVYRKTRAVPEPVLSEGISLDDSETYEFAGLFFRAIDTYDRRNPAVPYQSASVLSSHWWHLLALTLPFAARTSQLSIRRRRTRAIPTACKSCGYDLRAGHDKCPECGGESHVKVGVPETTNNPTAPTVQR